MLYVSPLLPWAGSRREALLSPEDGLLLWPWPPRRPRGTNSAEVFLPETRKIPSDGHPSSWKIYVAPALEVKAASETQYLLAGEDADVEITSSYLFGAPAAGLPFEAEVRASSAPFRPKGWQAFTFGDMEKKFEPFAEFIGDGTLDETGKGKISFQAPEGWSPPASVNLLFLLKVMEESGRWVSTSLSMPFHPYPVYLGIEKPSGDAVPGKETSLRVAAVTPEGTPAALDRVVGTPSSFIAITTW